MFDKKISRRDFIKMTSMTALAFAATNFFDDNFAAANKICTAKTRYGTFNGFISKGVKTWLGIPYAKPPVENLRWRAPEKLAPTDKIFDAKKFGLSPIQDIDPVEPASLLPQGEDCLTLNIWARNFDGHKPVMVFIPGGGFISGGSCDPLYNGARLAAAHDVVVVTINYRLNVFGFMNFAAIDSDFDGTGYLGIQDQVAALAWIKENVENFGGDPDNVTLFGESAGSISTLLLMVTPAAKGLFHKAIAQSGHLGFYHTAEYSARLAEEFMEVGGYKNMSELVNKPAAELEQTYEKLYRRHGILSEMDYLPTCDGKFLPEHPLFDLKVGAARDIKFLTGTTASEYRYWLLYYDDMLDDMTEFHTKITRSFYENEFVASEKFYQTWQKNHEDIAEDVRYLEFANQIDWRVGQELTAGYQSAFDAVSFYLFSQSASTKNLGSCHAIDLPFVFNNPSEGIETKPSAKLVKQVQTTWTTFAATGNPNNALIPQWKKYSVDDRETMEINSSAWTCHKDLNVQNLNELRRVYEDYLLD